MPARPLSLDDTEPDLDDGPERLSQNGQMIGIAIYGGLVLIGFFFGIVTGYERPKPPIVVVKKEKDDSTPPAAKVETPRQTPIVTPNPKTEPKTVNPPPEPKKPEVVIAPEPKKVDPSPQPKGNGTTPVGGKTDPPPTTVVISYEKHVKPILRTYCFNCHGAVGKPKGEVDLTSLAKIIDPNNPPILTPGDPAKSAIFTSIEDMAMPPEGRRPGKQELQIIREWILGGARP